jgi:hypothetical protein
VRRTRFARCAAILLALSASAAGAQLPLLVEGIADAEFWSTTARSNLLTRNVGHAAPLGRLQMWAAFEPIRRLVLYGQGEIEVGGARTEFLNQSYYADADQYGVRFTASRAFVFDGGKLAPALGTFAQRRFSNRNPLIGGPDAYTLEYPHGVMVSGEAKHFDYRAAMVTLPSSHEGYTPDPTPRMRPVIGGGYTPMVGLRFGGSFTTGSYLNDSFTPAQLRDAPWQSFDQRIFAWDASFARGYLETRFEGGWGDYEVPGRASRVSGFTYYGEAKYTFTPRFFLAGRAERNNYPFIRAFGTNWVARPVDFVNGEIGAGFRATASTLVKMTVRGDRWWVAPGAQGFLGQGGGAFAVQVSQAFDVVGFFERDR